MQSCGVVLSVNDSSPRGIPPAGSICVALLTVATMTRGSVGRRATRLLRSLAQANAAAEQSPALLPVFDVCNGPAASRAHLSTLAGAEPHRRVH